MPMWLWKRRYLPRSSHDSAHQMVDYDGTWWTKFVLGWSRANGESKRPPHYADATRSKTL
jgi:hypothetical protein